MFVWYAFILCPLDTVAIAAMTVTVVVPFARIPVVEQMAVSLPVTLLTSQQSAVSSVDTPLASAV